MVEQRGNATAAQTFAAALKRHGIDVVFGQSIPSQLHLAAPEFGIRQVGYRTENAGAAMADGYARVAHRVGVVTAQNGPAATLLVPGLAEALKASIPLLAIVQDLPRGRTDKNAFQDLDHGALFQGCTKRILRIQAPERIDDLIDLAIVAATSGRPGPVVLLCPYDLFDAAAPAASDRRMSYGACPLDRPVADPARLDEAARLLADAERPLIVAGGGIHLSGASGVLAALQEEAALPVATTTMGKGAVDERHPLSLGVVGYYMGTGGMARFQRPLIDGADVILLIGTRTNQNGTDSWSLFPEGARIIHLDADPEEIGRNYEALRLVGDARTSLAALLDALRTRDLAKRRAGRSALEAAILAARRRHEEEARERRESAAQPVRPERLMAEMDRRLTPETIVVADASYASIWVGNCLWSRRPGMRFITPRGIAGLGWGLPLALGAKVARPDAPVLCLAGDGGFAHSWAELETARRMGLAVVLTVLNNQGLGYQRDWEDRMFGSHTDVCHFEPVDHARIGEACGWRAARVEDPADYGPALDAALAAEEPTLIDVITDLDAHPPITLFEGHLPR
ncbi:MAG TPA: acetolactate synthase catalytic subunit [Geminicoccaceae bacterium]